MSKPVEIPLAEARAQFSRLVERVHFGGERFLVLRHGRPFAAVVPVADLEQEQARKPKPKARRRR